MKNLILFFFLIPSAIALGQWVELPQTIDPGFGNCSVAYNGKVYFTGGPQSQSVVTAPYNNKLYILDLATGAISTASGGLSEGRAVIMCAAYAGKIYFAGGYRFTGTAATIKPYKTVDVYDIQSDTWSVKSLSVARGEGAAVVLDGKIMFAGGMTVLTNAVPVKTVDIYDPVTDKWTVEFLSQARGGLSAGVAGKKVWFCGGYTSSTAIGGSDRVDVYDAETKQWSQASLSQAREGSTTVVAGKYLICAGGATTPDGMTDRVDIFDTSTGSRTTASLSAPRGYMAGVALGTKAYFTGGGHITPNSYFDKSSNVVDIFDAQTGLWTTGVLNKNRMAHTCAAWGNKIVVGGGWRAEQVMTTGSVEVFTDPSIVATNHPQTQKDFFSISPNPVSDMLKVSFFEKNQALDTAVLTVSDPSGKTMLQKTINQNEQQPTLDVSALSAGFYLLTIKMKNGRVAAKRFVLINR